MLQVAIEIIDGFSSFKSKRFGSVRLLHPGIREQAVYESSYEENLAKAIDRGIKTRKEALESAISSGAWSNENEKQIAFLERSIENAREMLNVVIDAQKQFLQKDINESTIKLYELKNKRSIALDRSAEDFAMKIAYEKFLFALVAEPKFEQSQFDYFDDNQINDLFVLLDKMNTKLSVDNIKKASVGTVIQNYSMLADNTSNLLEKPIFELTMFQSRFLYYIKYYGEIISSLYGKVNSEMLGDYEAMDEWMAATEENKDRIEKAWGAKVDDISSKKAISSKARETKGDGSKKNLSKTSELL